MDESLAAAGDALPLACTLTGEDRARRGEVTSDLLGAAEVARELDDGYAFRFPDGEEWARRILDYVVFERQCCRFFTFEIRFEPDQGAIWLHLRGPDGVKDFLTIDSARLGS